MTNNLQFYPPFSAVIQFTITIHNTTQKKSLVVSISENIVRMILNRTGQMALLFNSNKKECNAEKNRL